MRTKCASLVADLFLFCYERNFMKSQSRENQGDNFSISRYLYDLLKNGNVHFEQTVDQIYPTKNLLIPKCCVCILILWKK